MLSCAAIQKLERYGELGHKRGTIEDFVFASLSDVRRTNVYALTHLGTWQQCLDAIAPPAASDDAATTLTEVGSTAYSAPVLVSDSLIHAMSFTTAFLTYHVMPSPSEKTTDRTNMYVFEATTEKREQKSSFVQLIALLKHIAVCVAKEKGIFCSGSRVRTNGSVAFTQALGHLLSSITVFLFGTLSRLVQSQRKGSMRYSTRITEDELITVWNDGLVMHTAVCRQLRRAAGQHPDDALFSARPCSTALKAFFNRMKSRLKDGTSPAELEKPTCLEDHLREHPTLLLLLACAGDPCTHRSCLGSFHGFSLFQKLGFLHSLLGVVRQGAVPVLVESHTSSSSHPEVVQRLLCSLIASTACNRATRFVVYYRSDELKLMQNNVRLPSEYALHTFTTTPPIEASLVSSCLELASSQSRHHMALILAQWIVSVPYFYECFCTDPSWGSFAQEQRRTVLLRQSQERRGRRDERRMKKGAGATAVSGSASISSRASSVASVGEGAGGDNRVETASLMSQRTADASSRSLHSMESRASLLSTLSRRSTASYLSFLSVLRPEGGAAGEEVEPTKLHESADGNTNLPLILLEELVLALHQFMETYPADFLDAYGLRTLCWQSIALLFRFVQGSLTSASAGSRANTSGTVTAAPPPQVTTRENQCIFQLGQDIRYNHGLGYEGLGLLFAKVVAPQLEREPQEAEEAITDPRKIGVGRARILPGDAHVTKVCVEGSLSMCLAAYEMVAPQVVDMNLPVILRIAARTVTAAASEMASPVLHQFLANVVLRLGKCNQMVMLLDALVETPAKMFPSPHDSEAPASTEGDPGADFVALHHVVSHPVVRDALIQAAQLSMDPENILGHLIGYLTAWTLLDDNDVGCTPPIKPDAAQVLFTLQIVATIVEGISPTSTTSSAVLEKSAELEMLLVALFTEHLREETATSSTLFVPALRGKTRRQLCLHTLLALYQCREVTHGCLLDLGLQNVDAYLSMLDESLWQVTSNVGALVGRLTLEEVQATMSLTTRMQTAPYAHVRELLPQLALQRLTLAHSVSTALAVTVSPLADAKAMAHSVIRSLEGGEDGDDGTMAQVLNFADTITEVEWLSLVRFSKRKRVRQCLVSLLRVTFLSLSTTDRSSKASATTKDAAVLPLWLTRCLRCVGGTFLRAITDVYVMLSNEDVIHYAALAVENDARSLPVMLQVLQHVYSVLGRIPYWPTLVDKSTEWVCALSDPSVLQKATEAGRARVTHLRTRLLQLVGVVFSFEDGCADAMRRALVAVERSAGCDESTMKNGGSRRGLSRAYVQVVGVPLTSLEELKECVNADEEAEVQLLMQEWCFEEELQRLIQRIFTTDFLRVLMNATEALADDQNLASGAAVVQSAQAPMLILARLYQTCVATVPVVWRERVVSAVAALTNTTAAQFLVDVVRSFLEVVGGQEEGTFTVQGQVLLLGFLEAMRTSGDGSTGAARLAPYILFKEEDTKEAARTLGVIESGWLQLLRNEVTALLCYQWAEASSVRGVPGLLRLTLECFTALFDKLHASHTRSKNLAAAGKPRTRRGDKQIATAAEVADVAATDVSTSNEMAAFARLLLSDVNAQRLKAFFSSEGPSSGLDTMCRAVSDGAACGIEAIWVLYHLYEFISMAPTPGGKGHLSTVRVNPTLAALFAHYAPEATSHHTGRKEVLAAMQAARRDTSSPVNDTVFRGWPPHAADQAGSTRVHPCGSIATVQFYEHCLRAVPRVLHRLRADAAPAALHLFLHALLNEVVPTETRVPMWLSMATHSFTDGTYAEVPMANRIAGYRLLVAAAEALQALSQVPGMRFGSLKNHLQRLLWVSTLPYFSQGDRTSLIPTQPTLWSQVLYCVSVPSRALHEAESFQDALWCFLGAILEPHRTYAAPQATLTQAEVMLLMGLLGRTWLPLGILWRRPELLPNLMSALFACVLHGVQDQRYERRVLNQLASFFFQLSRHAEKDNNAADREEAAGDAEAHGPATKRHRTETYERAPSKVVSRATKLLAVAAVVSAMFQVSQHYVSVFTTYSSDLDFIAADLLRLLSHHRLPDARTAPIAYKEDVVIKEPGMSQMSLSDLVFTSVGDSESKALLRQAALRLEEEDTDVLVSERRHIFRVS